MKNPFVLLVWLFFLGAPSGYGQNIYGSTGWMKTPNAYTAGDGKVFAAANLYRDYLKSDRLTTTLFSTQSINIGFFPRLEIGIRLVNYKDTETTINDRNINLKLTVFKERVILPQLSVGFQDFTGTRRFNSTYVVCTKTIKAGNKISFIPSVGLGTKFTDLIYKQDAYDVRLQGVFASGQLTFARIISVMVDYQNQEFGSGILLNPFKWLYLSGYVSQDTHWGGMVGLHFTI